MDTNAHAATATVSTTLPPGRYLGQLCKHFEHKLPATYAADFSRGRIEFSVGVCELEADGATGSLLMRVHAATEADLERLEDVVARHLVRFAFREELAVHWTALAES